MSNAQRSSAYCDGGKCPAGEAVDGDINTMTRTSTALNPWWTAELSKITRIESIVLYLSEYNLNRGNYNNFKIETSMTEDSWVVCKGPYDVKTPIHPHIITCDKPTVAKYIRLSREPKNPSFLVLHEVKVNETKGLYFIFNC